VFATCPKKQVPDIRLRMEKFLRNPASFLMLMAKKLDVKFFGYYPEYNCKECSNYYECGGTTHRDEDGSIKALLASYGDRIHVSLVNVFSEDMKNYPEVADCIKKNGLRVPIVTVSGNIRLCGSESTQDAIKQVIDSELNKGPLSFLGRRS
jgi:hypothetical protein